MARALRRALRLSIGILVAIAPAWAQAEIRVVTDRGTYNAGSVVRVRVISTGENNRRETLDLLGTLRYAGEIKPILGEIPLASSFPITAPPHSTEFREFWKVPVDARTGRYEIELTALDSRSHRVVFKSSGPNASFAVHRKLVKIERIDLGKTFYTPGDSVACRVLLENLAGRPLDGLRVEFSDRYWPWTAQSSERAGVDFFTLSETLSLRPGAPAEVRSERAAVAPAVKQPSVHQYAVVVWDNERKNIYDITFSPLVFIYPPGMDSPKPYPPQYLYPALDDLLRNFHYRNFYPPQSVSSGIAFNHDHTMFASGSEGEVNFTVGNPTPQPWRRVSIRVRWLGPDDKELANHVVAQAIDLDPGAAPLQRTERFTFPPGTAGIYRAEVRVEGGPGEVLAASALELGVNPLPKSILVFCAHEDDEGAHSGIIRAAVENHIPIHFVYFTSGDAGSCDRYYQRSCGPVEALNFGELRMEETRASLGHLGVPREDIHFLGLPDGGSGLIWWDHVEPSNPYLSVLLASDHAPYEGLARPNLPYARRAAVEEAKDFIKKFQPEVIYTGHPDERHVDHRTNNWFVVKALQELVREGALPSIPTLLVDQVYGPGPQAHAPYHYEKHVLHVSGEARALGQEAEWYYQSQSGNGAQGALRTFDQLSRTEIHWKVLDWKEHEGWNEKH